MLYKYKCLITPNLDSKIFRFFTKEMIIHNLNRYKILNKWFYFYMNDPIQPIIIWNGYRLEPGTNRYVGVALRQSNTKIHGYLIVDHTKEIPKEIELLDFVESADIPMIGDKKLNKNSVTEKWGVRNCTSLDCDNWYKPAFRWIGNNLQFGWGVEYQNKIYYLNHSKNYFFNKKIKHIVKVEDFRNFEDAVTDLFTKVKEIEF